MPELNVEEELAKLHQSQLSQGAAYAGGLPSHIMQSKYGVETLMRTNYGGLIDIDEPHAWMRLIGFMGPTSTYCVGLHDLKAPPEERFQKHFDWKTELSLFSINIPGHEMLHALQLVGVDMPARPFAPIDGMRHMYKNHKQDCFDLIVDTIDYRNKKAAVAWTPGYETTDRKLKLAKRMGFEITKKNGITIARLKVERA